MRRALVLSLLSIALLLAPAAALADTPAEWQFRGKRASTAAEARAGRIGFAVFDHRGRYVTGRNPHQRFHSASVFKAMLLVCYLNDPRVKDRALSLAERTRLGAMVRASSDPAANAIYGGVRQSCIHRLARSSGMRGFTTSSFWGRTQITPYGTARLFWNIDVRIVARHRTFGMSLLRGVIPSQRWGLAKVVPRGMAISFKGGFAGSPGGGEIVSQGALFSAPNRHRIAVAVLTNNSPSQPYGRETLRLIGERLLRGYRPVPAVPAR